MSLLIAFLIGCVTTQMASQYVVPPIKAEATTQKLEFHCELFSHGSIFASTNEINKELNKLAKGGWEPALSAGGDTRTFWCFKRKVLFKTSNVVN